MHSEIAVFGEFQTIPKRLGRIDTGGAGLCSFHKASCALISPNEIRRLRNIYGPSGFFQPLKGLILHPFYVSRYARLCSKKYVVDSSKSPTWSMLMWRRYRWLMDQKFIIIHRDPRGVIASYVRRGETSPGQIETRAKLWANDQMRIEQMAKRIPSQKIHKMFYEKFATDPDGELRKICQFLGLDFDSRMLRFAEGAHHIIGGNSGARQQMNEMTRQSGSSATADLQKRAPFSGMIFLDQRWKDELTIGQRQIIESTCKTQMIHLNYNVEH